MHALSSEKSFHQDVAWVLLMGNFLGLPVCGVFTRNVTELRFTWRSARVAYSLSLLLVSLLILFNYIYSIIEENKFQISKILPFITHCRSCLCIFLFLKLAKRWPALMKKWSKAEQSLLLLNEPKQTNHLRNRITLLQFIVISSCVGEQNSIRDVRKNSQLFNLVS